MKRKQWKKPDDVERDQKMDFNKIDFEINEKRDKSNNKRVTDVKAKRKTIAIVGVIVILALIIFVAISQRKTIQEMIIKAQEQMQNGEEVSNSVARATGITSVDLTGLVTGEDVEHTHIYEAKYDESYHWEECWICGDIQNKETHNFQENWIDGDSCSPDNLLIHSCACGYSYSTPNTRPHTPYNFYSYNQKYHIIMCSVCQAPLTDGEDHKDANGITINCSHGGTCDVCGNTFEASHFITHRFTTDLKQNSSNCWFCGRNIIDMDNSQISLTYDENNVYSYEAKIVIDSNVNFQQIEVVMGDFTYYYRADIISKSYSISGREITLTSTGRFHDDVEVVDTHLTTIYIIDDQGKKWILEEWVDLLPDKKAPTITSATVEGNGTINNYTKKATITVNATENWCSTVYMALYSTQGVCLRDYVAANSLGNGNFQGTIDVVGEYREPQDLIVKVKDYLGNETEVPVTVQYIDAKAPDLTNEEDYTSEWSKTKEVTFNAQDLGVGNVQIAFNNIDDYQEANGEGDNYTRTYNFYGDVYDKVTAAIYLKDALGNEQVVRVDIGKLDGTAPTITKAELQNKIIVLEANDMHETLGEGSGVAGYRYVASLEDNGTVITENSGTYITENQIDISNMSKVKYVYIAPVDEVGNIGETVKVELPTYSYTVNYYEEGTEEKVAESKVVGDKAIGEEIEETAINIAGYNAIEPTTQSIEIGVGTNEIIFYYSKRTDIEYRVEYYYDEKIDESKTERYTGTYEEVITEYEDKITEKYELEKVENLPLTIGANEEENVIKVWYVRKDARVVVHHYIEGTEEQVPSKNGGVVEDEIIEGKVDDEYSTEEAKDIPANYECVGKSNNTSGNMTIEEIEVIYYYGLKEAQIENNIEMTGTEKIIEEDEEVEYRISSNVEVNTYIGDMTVTIVVTLPYEIDEEKSELNGGIYNSTDKTITWTERIEGVDTFTEGIEEINREKNITVVYENIDYSKISFEAKVETKVELETPKQEDTTEPVIVVTETEFTKEVKVTKIWNHTNNIYKIPSEVKVQVKNGTVVEEEKVINSSNKVNDDENTWTWTFTDLPKYNSEGKEIEYTVDEEEVNAGDLAYYRKEIEYVENATDEDVEEVIIRNTYNGAVINAEKEVETENGKNYVLEGEKITYTIKVSNRGDLGQDVIVKDTIPSGTSFVTGSIKVNRVADTAKTASDLTNGIRVNVPAKEDESTPGEALVSFEVTVDKVVGEKERTISNTATINKDPDNPSSEEETTNGTEMPVLIYNKTAEIIKADDVDKENNNNISYGAVTAGDRIKYTITINNVGNEPITNVEIKDTVPEGTTIYQINDNGEISLNERNEITWEIDNIGAGETKKVSFEVTVNYDKEGKTIRNVATIDGKDTNGVEILYEVPEVDIESSMKKTGLDKITSTEDKISYTITYRAEIGEFVGKGKVKIVDYLPYEIDEANSELDGGTYNKEAKTITWNEDLGDIDTYGVNEVIEIERSKTITIKYKYPDEENLSGTIENRVEGEITLIQEKEIKNPENPDEPIIEEETIKEETKECRQEVKVEIPAKVIVHHYIYDEEAGGETEEQVPSKTGEKVADEEKEGIVGDSYTTTPSNEVNENYQCVNTTPENYAGTMTKTDKEVIYYYQLKTAEVGGEIEKTAEASKEEEREYETGEVDGEGNPITATKTVQILTEEDGVVTYKIKYRAGIKEYKGKATITIVDKLPAEIDVEDTRVELDGGTYNSTDKTITWVDEVEVDTFVTGEMYDQTFEKEIKIVYKDQNVVGALINTVEGRVEIYYPEGHSTNSGGERDTSAEENIAEVEQEYRVAKEVEKVWEDDNDVKGNRPESVTVQLTANGNTNYGGQELEKVVLNETNNWKYTFMNLPKYNEFGQEIEYSVKETETNPGDLEYYDTPIVTKTSLNETTEGTTANERITVTNKYKLMNTEMETRIEKTGTDKVISSKEEVSYRITYEATITEYIGEAIIKIVDTLPYKLAKDENENLIEGIELAGGTYDEGTQTITWEERIEHINTYTNGEYKVKIEKEIKVVYEDLDATQRSMTNRVKGTVDLYETEQTNTTENTVDTIIEVPGKVEVKYIDRETGKEIAYIEQGEGEETVEKTYGYEINGLAGDMYRAEEKVIPGYTYVENSGNTEGNMVEGTIKVIYYYERTISGGVEVRYIDEETREEIAESETIEGRVGDEYKAEQKDIYGYEYVRVEGETEGKLTEEEKEVVYIYKKIPAKVIVRYLEKDETEEDDSDNKVLRIEEVIEGYVGDSYTTERQVIENYRATEPEPSNKEGEMTQEDIYVTYYYEKIPSGILTVKYVDVETREEILYKAGDNEEAGEYKTYREEMQGYVGEKYETEQKDIPYYKIVEELIPANREGRYTEENVEVTYYYKKQIFDMNIDKNVERIEINGEEQEVIDGKINKVEVVGSKVKETEVKITYRIEVRNEGEIEGIARIKENIPEDFEVNEETGEEWKETEEGKLEAEVELEAGETKELKVVLNWKKGDNNFGVQKNTAEIVETSNPANYEEANKEDNSSSSEVVMGVKTGDATRSIIFIIATIGMIISLLVFIYVADKYMKEYKSRNDIK